MRANFTFFLLLLLFKGYTQDVVRGLVADQEDEPVRFAHVYNVTMGLGQVSDINGHFGITASRGDTLEFSSMGYQKVILEVASIHLVNYVKISLPSDTIMLPSITIYSDRYYKVPLNYKGEPMEIEGVPKPGERPPIQPGDISLGAVPGPYGVPMVGAGINGPITYFSRDEKEKRKLTEAVQETQETLFYQHFIYSDSVRKAICRQYNIDTAQYEQVLIEIHRTFPEIQQLTTVNEIRGWLKTYFDRKIKDDY